jgi:cytochrome c-type biogenesis protein CcmE
MLRRRMRLWLLVIGFFLISACGPEVLVLGGIVGSGAGTYYFINGELATDYSAPFDKVWSACEKTVADIRGKDVQPKREIGTGSIHTVIEDENVKISVNYKNKNLTSVGIRVGLFGNKLSSQLLHDKIYENVVKK